MLRQLRKSACRGQVYLEYAMILIIVIGAFVAFQNYFKRALSGRFKETVDGIGDQYDPRVADSTLRHSIASNTYTTIEVLDQTVNGVKGMYTDRVDSGASIERKTGSIEVGAY